MRRRNSALLLVMVLATGSAACSDQGSSADAAVEDAAGGDDLDNCEAQVARWKTQWSIRTEDPALPGPTPANNLTDVWGPSAMDVYAVGFAGTILHWDGTTWTPMESGTTADLLGVWGFVLKDETGAEVRREVFAVGNGGTVLRYSGTDWQPQLVVNDPDPDAPDPQPVEQNLHDVWGVAAPGINPDDHPVVVAVGSQGLIVRWDPVRGQFLEHRERVTFTDSNGNTRVSWQRFTPERLGGVFGTSANAFVSVGNNGTILEYDGASWQRRTISGFVNHLQGIWGTGANNIKAVGVDGTLIENRGGTWQVLSSGLPAIYFRSTWRYAQSKCGPVPDGGTEPTDTAWEFFVGWDGALWVEHDGYLCSLEAGTSNRLEAVWGNTPRSETDRTVPDAGVECDPVEVIVGGVNGTLLRLDNPRR